MPPSLSTQLAATDLVGLAQLVHAGDVTPRELVEAAIERADRLDPSVGAIITRLDDEARDAADAIDPARPLPVPYLLKDIGAGARGVRSTWASDWVADEVPAEDSHLAARLRGAGLIFLGATAVPELGIAASTESERFGPTRNPWDLSRTAGGSSGGAAAAVASGIVPAAHANDGSGSIRIPASCCGLFGLKPSRGRVSSAPGGEWLAGATATHAITRTVRDSAALLDVVAGAAAGDLFTPAPFEAPLLEAIERVPGRLRVALSVEAPGGTAVDPECVAAAVAAGELLERLGHDVDDASPPIPFAEVAAALGVVECAAISLFLAFSEQSLGPATGALPPVIADLRAQGGAVTAQEYLAAELTLQRLARPAAAFWERYDLWLTPTLGSPPVALGEINVRDVSTESFFARDRVFNPWGPLANWLGTPAATVPLHWTGDGLPVGVQLMARVAGDLALLRVCRQLEQAQPWHHLVPPVHTTAVHGGSR